MDLNQKKGTVIFRTGVIITSLLLAIIVLSADSIRNVSQVERIANISLDDLPMEVGQWRGMQTAGIDQRSRDILQLSEYIQRIYRKTDVAQKLKLYIGYWAEQSGDFQAAKHSPSVCLPANGWEIEEQRVVEIEFTDRPRLKVNRLIARYGTRRSMFYYWFFSGQDIYWREWEALVRMSIQNIYNGRTDGGIIEVGTEITTNSIEGEILAEETIVGFIGQIYPDIQEKLNR